MNLSLTVEALYIDTEVSHVTQPPVQQCVDLNTPPHLHFTYTLPATLMMIAPTFIFHSFKLLSHGTFTENLAGPTSQFMSFFLLQAL